HRGLPSTGAPGEAAGCEGRPAVESKPTEPQQGGAEHRQREIVRARRAFRKAVAFADYQGKDQSSRASRNMDYYPACEINRNHICFTTSGSKQQSGNRLRRV